MFKSVVLLSVLSRCSLCFVVAPMCVRDGRVSPGFVRLFFVIFLPWHHFNGEE